jgi:FkbM family methyltransferase
MHSKEFIETETNTPQFNFVLNFFKHKKGGIFIEMGATDGIIASNTYCLETHYGWDGILIEPIKDYFDDIKKYRKTKYAYNICIGENEGFVEFTRIEGYSKMLSGISIEYPEQHKNRINKEVKERDQQIHIDLVSCKKLITVLKESNVQQIDYLSIDVEGGELSVLKSLEMEKNSIRPTIIGCENNYKTNEIESYLNQFNYKKVATVAADDMYQYNI